MTASAAASHPAVTEEEPEFKPVEVSRRIEASAATIFSVLADPRMHTDIDGSGTARKSPAEVLTDVTVSRI